MESSEPSHRNEGLTSMKGKRESRRIVEGSRRVVEGSRRLRL